VQNLTSNKKGNSGCNKMDRCRILGFFIVLPAQHDSKVDPDTGPDGQPDDGNHGDYQPAIISITLKGLLDQFSVLQY
jgi:hypothetical protein